MAIQGEGSAFELVRTPDGDRAAWLAERKKGVGGSDVAAIMGLSPWRSAYEVWCEKCGLTEPEDISEKPAVVWGNILEPVVGRRYTELHPDREVRRVNAVCRSIARPWAQASLDYEVRDPDEGWGVLEIKTAGLRSAHQWEDGVPLHYLTQVMHYLSVTGRPFADVAVLIGGQDYREYRVMADTEDMGAVDSSVDAFWRLVEERTEPGITGAAGEAEALLHRHAEDDGGVLELDDAPDCAREFLAARHDKEAAEARYRRVCNQLKAFIGDRRGIEVPGAGRYTWVRGERTSIDYKRYAEDHPGCFEGYEKVSQRDGGIRFTAPKED